MKNAIQPPTLEQLSEELKFITQEKVDGIPGVIVFDSGVPGPTLGITAMTHSNEPSGLAVIWHYRRAGELQKRLTSGKVVMVLNNLESSADYFRLVLAGDKVQSSLARLKDINMNRLPKELLDLTNDGRYEVGRAQELLPIWRTFDIGMDIHSTSQESSPMIVAVGGFHSQIVKGFPMEVLLTNCENIQIGRPACYFYGPVGKNIPSMVIETGYHENASSFILGIECVEKLLGNLGMIETQEVEIETAHKFLEYRMNGSLVVPNSSYRMARRFIPFEFVKKGELLAGGDQGDMLMPFDGHLLFPKGRIEITEKEAAEELMFYAEPVREIQI